MSELDEIRERLDALEEVARLRQDAAERREDAAATRTLAAMADRDAAEVRGALRAHTQALNALRETQMDQGRTLAGHGQTLETIAHAVGAVTTEQARQSQTLIELTTMVRRLVDRIS